MNSAPLLASSSCYCYDGTVPKFLLAIVATYLASYYSKSLSHGMHAVYLQHAPQCRKSSVLQVFILSVSLVRCIHLQRDCHSPSSESFAQLAMDRKKMKKMLRISKKKAAQNSNGGVNKVISEGVDPAIQDFRRSQADGTYSATFDRVSNAGRVQLNQFPILPPQDIPSVITMTPEKQNHVGMEYGFVEYDFSRGVRKGETASGYGDDFCQVHGITRVFVVDRANHIIAMCTPHRYMSYMANQMYASEPFPGNIFEFGGGVVASPRWAMRAAAWNILMGQGGQILKQGDTITVTASRMIDGVPKPPCVVATNIPYRGVSWVVMNKWMEQARSHNISIVEADTGLSRLDGTFDKTKTLPLVIREDETDMFMGEPVTGLVIQDDRFRKLRELGVVREETKAIQFRGGWYAPYNPSGITRVMRILKADGEATLFAADGSGPWRKPERAYSDNFVEPPSREFWVIGGVDDIHEHSEAIELGTHLEMTGIHLEPGTGGFNTES